MEMIVLSLSSEYANCQEHAEISLKSLLLVDLGLVWKTFKYFPKYVANLPHVEFCYRPIPFKYKEL